MVGFIEVVAVAFVAQLAVLPGEKVQFIIAGLSTRYHPGVVVAAAGLAFALWTALEVAFGTVLQEFLPTIVLDGITAGLFFLFAVLLYESAGATETGRARAERLDTGLLDPGRFGTAPAVFALMAAGEVGDKTQLVTIGLAAQFGAHPGIWVGEMLAILPVSAANALVFHRVAGRLDLRLAHLAGAAVFLFFGLDTVLAMVTGVSVFEIAVRAVADVAVA